ncbi:MAG: prohibitin family protein [Clostridia bacterium]|nr:prohibitin family protein [Clostridia bacterium]
MLFFVAGIVLTIAAFVALGFKKSGKWGLGPKQLLSILFLALCVFGCVKSIPTGYTGIVTTFGRVEDDVLDAGLHLIKPTQNVVLMDNREQRTPFAVNAFSSDIQQTSVTGSVNYMIDKSTAMTLYKEVGVGYQNVLIQPRILEDVKAVFSRYTAENLIASRDDLSNSIEGLLQNDLEQYGIIVMSVSIEDIDFTDVFTNAVEAKQVAAQEKLTAETKQQQAIMEAEAAAERQKIAAEAAAEVQKVEADAEAYATKTKAEAEAEANRMLSESLTQSLIDYQYSKAWDGKLPTTMLGEGSVPVLNVDPDTVE